MILSDNRRIVPNAVFEAHYKHLPRDELERIIPLHPEFRMLVLANRPGFPFLGNDFFSVLGKQRYLFRENLFVLVGSRVVECGFYI